MYLSYYNLNKKPFQISPNPIFLWMGEQYKEAIATLEYGILDNRGLILLTGEIGTGKTTLINALIKRQGKNTIIASITDPEMEKLDFYNFIAHSFNLNKKFQNKGDFLVHFSHFLYNSYSKNEKILLIIDEAQRLTHELLEEIRHLSNIEKEYSKLLVILLVGQNELNSILNQKINKALRQRITLNYNLSALNKKDTSEYIKHRLKVSGGNFNIFTSDALSEIYAFSKGYPRLINTICDHALLSGYTKDITKIDKSVIKECSKELLLPEEQKEPTETIPLDDNEILKHLSAGTSRRKKTIKIICYTCFSLFILTIISYYIYVNKQIISSIIEQTVQSIDRKIKLKNQSYVENNKTENILQNSVDHKKPAAKTVLSENKTVVLKKLKKKIITKSDLQIPKIEENHVKEDYREKIKRILPLKDQKLIVYFDLNSNDIPAVAYNSLNLLSQIMSQHPDMKIIIKGYADASGLYSYNKMISKFRATVVKNYLVGKKITPDQIKIIGMGPVETNDKQKQNRNDRRVEIEFPINTL